VALLWLKINKGGYIIMAANRSIDNHTFFENATTIGISDYMITSDASQMNLEFVCDGTFEAKITADNYPKNVGGFYDYPCYKLPSYESMSTITDDGYLYNVDVSGIDYLRVEILSLTGTLSVYAKVVG
jgi:hypothetical protein